MKAITLILFASATLVACNGKDGDTGADNVDLGSVTTDTGGLTGPIEVDVPANADSVLFWCGPYGDSLLGTAWEIKDPDGNYYYTNSYHEDHSATKMRVGNHDDFLPVLFPVSPDHDISAGLWTIDVWVASKGAPQTFDCGVVTDNAPSGDPTIDVHFVFVGLSDLDASSADGDGDLQALIDRVGTLWSGAGLSLGEVSYEDFSGDVDTYSVLYMSDDDSTEFNALMRTANPPDPESIVIFLVQEISNASGSTVFGLAAGPPGAATLSGTSKSGMVVGAVDMRDSTDFVALVTAHEGAHFLGLFHTSEKDGSSHDPLSDTAECASSADTDGNGRVDSDECAGMGGDNVMFWSPPEDATEFTSDQAWVLGRNPAVR